MNLNQNILAHIQQQNGHYVAVLGRILDFTWDVNESGGLFNKYIDKDAYQKHVYNKENLLNDWFVVKSSS